MFTLVVWSVLKHTETILQLTGEISLSSVTNKENKIINEGHIYVSLVSFFSLKLKWLYLLQLLRNQTQRKDFTNSSHPLGDFFTIVDYFIFLICNWRQAYFPRELQHITVCFSTEPNHQREHTKITELFYFYFSILISSSSIDHLSMI